MLLFYKNQDGRSLDMSKTEHLQLNVDPSDILSYSDYQKVWKRISFDAFFISISLKSDGPNEPALYYSLEECGS